jgi:hypothetical protein
MVDSEETMNALSRTNDPLTSQLAAAEIVSDLANLHDWTVQCVSESPGLTQRELGAKYCPLDLRKIGRRLNECEKLGRVRRGEARKCSLTYRLAETWWPALVNRPQLNLFGEPA